MNKGKILKSIILPILVFMLIIAGCLVFFNIVKQKKYSDKEIEIVTTNFAAYDFARALTSGIDESQVDIEMLLKPGGEAHEFEPTPQDIVRISNADLFIYNGGESEDWVEKLIDSSEIDRNAAVRMMELVNLKTEDGNSSDEEYDEHVWTSPKNNIMIIEGIEKKLVEKFPNYQQVIQANADSYKKEFVDISKELERVVASAKERDLIFADRFPFGYLARDYGLNYLAAFPGCSEQTEASSADVAALIKKVNDEKLGVILKIELTSDALAKVVAEATGAKILTLNSAHSISQEDFDKGVTLADIMRDNLVVLAEALN